MNKDIENKYILEMKKMYEEDKYDVEKIHSMFDYYLIELLKELGYTKIADLYEKVDHEIGFWYA